MYKLYNCSIGQRLIDVSKKEEDLQDTLGTYLGYLDTIDYKITQTTCDGEKTRARIKSIDDYEYYRQKTKVKKR